MAARGRSRLSRLSGKAKQSYFHSERLIEAGLNNPAPVAGGVLKALGWMKASTLADSRLSSTKHASFTTLVPQRIEKARL